MTHIMSKKGKSTTSETDDLLVFGYSCKLFRDDEKARTIDEGQHLIPWMGNDSLKIDRYDGRGALFDLSRIEAPPGGFDVFIELTESERAVEMACDEERYRSLHTNEDEDKLYKEEEEKRREDEKAYGQVCYSYEERKLETVKEEVEVDDDRPFVPSPVLDIPVNMVLPTTMKHNAVIEKTAMFISSQGTQMEIILKAKQTGNPMFDFLTFGNPLHGYYRLILGYIKSGRYVPNDPPEPVPEEPAASVKVEVQTPAGGMEEPSAYSELLLQLKMKAQFLKKEQEEKLAIEKLLREQELARKRFEAARIERLRREAEKAALESNITVPPDVLINIAKMASYAAKNGRKFEAVVRNKKDTRFGFLEPTHEFHEFYLKKIKSYQDLHNDKPEATPPPPPAIKEEEEEGISSKQITPISFAIKPKEVPTIKEKSALPIEENSDSEAEDNLDSSTDNAEYELIEGSTQSSAITDKRLQLERKRKVSAFLKSLNVKECEETADAKKARTSRSCSLDGEG